MKEWKGIICVVYKMQTYQLFINETNLWENEEACLRDVVEAAKITPNCCRFIRNKHTNQSEGYGFIDFDSLESASIVLSRLTNARIPSVPRRRFTVKWGSATQKIISTRDGQHKCFVGNLPPNTNPFELRDFFKTYIPGTTSARIVKDFDGNPLGYGFVSFLTAEDAKSALSINGATFFGKPLTVGEPQAQKGKKNKKPTLIVTNVNTKAAKLQILEKFFKKYDNSFKIKIRDDNSFLVTFESETAAGNALKGLTGTEITPGQQCSIEANFKPGENRPRMEFIDQKALAKALNYDLNVKQDDYEPAPQPVRVEQKLPSTTPSIALRKLKCASDEPDPCIYTIQEILQLKPPADVKLKRLESHGYKLLLQSVRSKVTTTIQNTDRKRVPDRSIIRSSSLEMRSSRLNTLLKDLCEESMAEVVKKLRKLELSDKTLSNYLVKRSQGFAHNPSEYQQVHLIVQLIRAYNSTKLVLNALLEISSEIQKGDEIKANSVLVSYLFMEGIIARKQFFNMLEYLIVHYSPSVAAPSILEILKLCGRHISCMGYPEVASFYRFLSKHSGEDNAIAPFITGFFNSD